MTEHRYGESPGPTASARRLVLLDFDGVLNSDAYFSSPEFRAESEGMSDAEIMLLGRSFHLERGKIALLNRIVEASGAEVVISSSWRLRHSLDELNAMLAERGASFRATGVTPTVDVYDPSPLRAREILAYLAGLSPAPEAVVVLDDACLGDLVADHVAIDGSLGLQEHHVTLCIAKLTGAAGA